MTRKEMVFQMFLTQHNILKGEIIQLQQNIRYRQVSTIDCIELIIAKEKFEYLREMSHWVFATLRIDEDEYLEKLYDDFIAEQKKNMKF